MVSIGTVRPFWDFILRAVCYIVSLKQFIFRRNGGRRGEQDG